jgi:probable phosphoglycerate mutase
MTFTPGPQSLLAITHLIVIRHGETAWNRERRLQGQLDIPLNDTGHAQARALAGSLAGEPVDAIYSSDLSRAMQTAAPLSEVLGVPVQSEPRLRERCYGTLEGMTYAEVAQQRPEDFARWQARVRRHPGERIALVAHGGVLDCLYREATGMTLEAPREHELLNASVNRLRSDSHRLTVAQWADVSHLATLTLDEVDRRVP